MQERAQGPSGVPDGLVLSKTAGARGEHLFFNGLIAWPAQTGEDRISLRVASVARKEFGSDLDTP